MFPSSAPTSDDRSRRLLTRVTALCCLGAALLLTSSGMAQEQDRKLMDRIDRPNMERNFQEQTKGFNGGKSFSGGKDARVKSFYSPARFRSKDYLTGAYREGSTAWRGDFTYDTKSANTEGRGNARRMVREHRTRSAAVHESRDANRGYSTRKHATADRRSDYRGKSQDKIDIYGPQAVTSIPGESGFRELRTIDDIRNLLNKD